MTLHLWEAIRKVEEEGGTATHSSGGFIEVVDERIKFGDPEIELSVWLHRDCWTYKPPAPKLVSAAEAFKALKDGREIARSAWNGISRLRRDSEILDQVIAVFDTGGSGFFHPLASDLVAEDWEIL